MKETLTTDDVFLTTPKSGIEITPDSIYINNHVYDKYPTSMTVTGPITSCDADILHVDTSGINKDIEKLKKYTEKIEKHIDELEEDIDFFEDRRLLTEESIDELRLQIKDLNDIISAKEATINELGRSYYQLKDLVQELINYKNFVQSTYRPEVFDQWYNEHQVGGNK